MEAVTALPKLASGPLLGSVSEDMRAKDQDMRLNNEDIWAAFLMNQATLIPTESWVVEESLEAATTRDNIDDYCNLAILMFARLINLINTFPNDGSHSEVSFPDHINQTWARFEEWWRLRPEGARPVICREAMGTNTFPTIVFTQSSASK